jgi:hypothetical protein
MSKQESDSESDDFFDEISNLKNKTIDLLKVDSSKVYKIKYTLSLFPSFGEHLEKQRYSRLGAAIDLIKLKRKKFINSDVQLI